MAADTPLSVFLSYSRRDKSLIERLQARLDGSEFDVLIDVEDIRPGEAWRTRLLGMIDAAHVVVFALTASSLASRVCLWELEQARAQKKRMIIVSMEDHDKTRVPRWMRALNYVSMRTEAEIVGNLARLADGIRVAPRWLRYHTRLQQRARTWENASQLDEELLAGSVLKEAEQFVLHPPTDAPEVGDLVRQFVMASAERERAEQEAALRAAEARAAEERRLRQDAESRALAARSQSLATQKHDLAGLLAVEAWTRAPTDLARIALCQSAMSHPRLMQMLAPVGSYTHPGAKFELRDGAAFSADGRYLAHVQGVDRDRLRVWKLDETPQHVGDTPAIDPTVSIVCIGFAGPAQDLMLQTNEGTLLRADKNRPDRAFMQVYQTDERHIASVFAASATHHEVFIAAGRTLQVVNLEKGTQTYRAKSHFEYVSRVCWMAGGLVLITGTVKSQDPAQPNPPACALLDPRSNRFLREDPGHAAPCNSGTAYFRTVEGDRDVMRHHRSDEFAPRPWFWNRDNPTCFAIQGDTEEMAFADDARIHLANAASGAHPRYAPVHERPRAPVHGWYVNCLQPGPPGGQIGYVSLAPDGSVALWSKDRRNPLSRHLHAPFDSRWKETTSPVRQLAYQSDLSRIARLNEDGQLVIWERGRSWGKLLKAPPVSAIHFADKRLFGVLTDGRVAELKSATRPLAGVRFDPTIAPRGAEGGLIGRTVEGTFAAFDAGQATLNHLGDWAALDLDEDEGILGKMDYCAVTGLLAVPRASGQVDIFRSVDGRFEHVQALETVLRIEDVSLTQNGARLLIAGCEAFEVWDAVALQKLTQYGTGSGLGATWRTTIDPTAHFIAGKGDYGGTLTLYDASDGTQITTVLPLGAKDAGIGMIFAPDGSELAIDDAEGGLFLLDFRPESWVKRITDMAGRSFTPAERRIFLGSSG